MNFYLFVTITVPRPVELLVYLIEEFLFFNHYKFHKQKIAFHRATMKTYQDYLQSLGKKVHYIDALSDTYDVRILIPKLIKNGLKDLHIIDPNDNWLEKHINGVSKDIEVTWYDNPLFINTKNKLQFIKKLGKNRLLLFPAHPPSKNHIKNLLL